MSSRWRPFGGLLALLLGAFVACSEERVENEEGGSLLKAGSGGASGGASGASGVGGAASGAAGTNGGNGGAQGGAGAPVLPLAVDAEPWNAGAVDTGAVSAVAEHEGRVVLFGERGVQVLAGGALAALDPSVTAWRGAAVIPAADGPGSWVAGLDATGQQHRLVNLASLEPISARYGLEDDDVRAFAASPSEVVFALPTGIAVASGEQVARFDLGAVSSVAIRGSRVAAVLATSVVLFNTEKKNGVSFDLSGVKAAMLDEEGRLVVSTGGALLAQPQAGDGVALGLVHEGKGLGALAAAGGRVWFREEGELGTYVPGAVARSAGLKLGEGALAPSSSGGVWALGGAEPLRFALGGASADEKQWQAAVQPAFARACSKCHLPGGTGGKDLSTYAAWTALRAKINDRVVVKGDMPPAGNPISEEDRSAIAAWCAASP